MQARFLHESGLLCQSSSVTTALPGRRSMQGCKQHHQPQSSSYPDMSQEGSKGPQASASKNNDQLVSQKKARAKPKQESTSPHKHNEFKNVPRVLSQLMTMILFPSPTETNPPLTTITRHCQKHQQRSEQGGQNGGRCSQEPKMQSLHKQ